MDPSKARFDAEVRLAALRAGIWLGWLSVAAVLLALALGLDVKNQRLLIGLVLAAAAANALIYLVPRDWWTMATRGERMLDLWSAGLLTLVVLLVMTGGGTAGLDLLLFLMLPFLATVRGNPRRTVWILIGLVTFGASSFLAPDPLPPDQIALRACLLVAASLLALVLADATRRGAASSAELQATATLERALRAETHHRVKNSLQTVADLLFLSRPQGAAAQPFDETASRVRAIGAVHRLLAEQGGTRLDASELLGEIAKGGAPEASLMTEKVLLDASMAQHLGIVANELIANAARHGEPPIALELTNDSHATLIVRDQGHSPISEFGLGLRLVDQIVTQGLDGKLTIEQSEGTGTEVRVEFKAVGS